MLEAITEDFVNCVRASSHQPMFSAVERYDEMRKIRDEALEKWKSLPSQEKGKFKNLTNFFSAQGVPDLKAPELQPARNLSLITEEVRARIDTENDLRLLPLKESILMIQC
jgi:hypothetical protein